jgi:peptide/nickel transport system substrate-binding protein
MRPKRLATFCAAAALGVGPAAVLDSLSAAAAEPGTVVLGRVSDGDRYDPHRSSALGAAEVLYMIGDTLVTLDYDLQTVRPGLAESWDLSDDGLAYTFRLRDDVTFCDGKKFTSKDVVGTMERWLKPDAPNVSTWKAGVVDSITAPDDYTVHYKLKEPNSALLYQMAQFNFIMIDPAQAEALGEDFGVTAFNGTGPFCFESWQPRESVVLRRHEGYSWGPDYMDNQGPAKVETVIWKIVPEEATLAASITAGEVDASYALPYWSLAPFEADPATRLLRPDASFRTHYLGMKISRPLLQHRTVREAVSLAIDQSAIAEAIFFGAAEPATAYYSDKALDYNPQIDQSPFGYDPGRAAALLAQAGWSKGADGILQKDGQKLSLMLYGFNVSSSRQAAEAVQSDLRKVGIELTMELYDNTAIWGKLREQTYDLYQMDYPYLNAGDALNLYFLSENVPSPNRMMWEDETTDRLIEAGNKAVNDASRHEAYAEAGKVVHDALLWKPLVNESLVVVTGSRLKPFKPHGISGAAFNNGLILELN